MSYRDSSQPLPQRVDDLLGQIATVLDVTRQQVAISDQAVVCDAAPHGAREFPFQLRRLVHGARCNADAIPVRGESRSRPVSALRGGRDEGAAVGRKCV